MDSDAAADERRLSLPALEASESWEASADGASGAEMPVMEPAGRVSAPKAAMLLLLPLLTTLRSLQAEFAHGTADVIEGTRFCGVGGV